MGDTQDPPLDRLERALGAALPRLVWVPVFYLAFAPVAFALSAIGAAMPWSFVGLVLAGTWVVFGAGTARALLLWVVVTVIAIGMVADDATAGPVGRARGASRRVERYVKWRAFYSIFG